MTEPSTTDYVPIACSLHSEYELAVLHRQPLHLVCPHGRRHPSTTQTVVLQAASSRDVFVQGDMPGEGKKTGDKRGGSEGVSDGAAWSRDSGLPLSKVAASGKCVSLR